MDLIDIKDEVLAVVGEAVFRKHRLGGPPVQSADDGQGRPNIRYDDRVLGGVRLGIDYRMYGTVFLHREQQDLVSHVYVNDGPGLCPSVVSVALPVGYAEKTTRILPEYSVFGRLFEIPGISEKIVSSSYEGIMEHAQDQGV